MVLAGGTGGAALASGIQSVASEHELTVIANTADDDHFWGLLVCPDIDAVIYRLAGVFNEAAGFGVKNDTFFVLEGLRRIGEDTWFGIGDKDFATHVLRADMLRRNCTLTEATLALCTRFGLRARVLPMSDQPVRTRFATERGDLSFQEYFVREHLKPKLVGISFAGMDSAHATPEVIAALDAADLVIIGPSNPLISIAPITHLVGKHLRRECTLAVTPIVAGLALKGPTVEMMHAVGLDPNPIEVARMYSDFAGGFVVDERDRNLAGAIETMGYRVLVADTIMRDRGVGLARLVLSYV